MTPFDLTAGGHRLEAVWHGEPARRALVFLHEGLGSVSLWRDFPAQVAAGAGLPALVYSRAGYGRSDRHPPPWPLDFMAREAEVLDEVLDRAGIERAVLIGHSDGATIALLHAARPGSRAERLVLLAPHVFCEALTRRSIQAAVDGYARLRPALQRHHGDNVDDAFHGWSGVWLDPAFAAWTIEDALPRVAAPALVIQGADDPYGTLAQVDAILRRSGGPTRRLVLPGCGHAPHREAERVTVEATVDCVRDH